MKTCEYDNDGYCTYENGVCIRCGGDEPFHGLHTIYSTITVRPEVEQARIEAFLYDHSALVLRVEVHNGDRECYVMRTDAETLDRCEYLANYQAGRLLSAPFGVRVIGTDLAEATSAAQEAVRPSTYITQL